MSVAPALIESVSVLYVDPRGPYPSLVRDWYDATRDARAYAGPNPVVAHPPCGPWSSLRSLSHETTKDCGPHAVSMVRQYGGVLEHPRGSKLWEHCRMPKTGALPDVYGGLTFEVDQCDWGHVARKRTWLYIVGTRDLPVAAPKREPTHWVSGVHTPGARGKPPAGIKICSAEQRRRTPVAFAQLLLTIAQKCWASQPSSNANGDKR
jgi:hypothetical protein